MRTTLLSTAILVLSSASSTTLAESIPIYKLHHRFLPHPSPQSPPTYLPLGNFNVLDDSPHSSAIALLPSEGVENTSIGGQSDDGKGWYQFAVQLGEHDTPEEWLMTSTRSCYLASSPPKIEIHLSSSSIPSSISILPTSTDGCSFNNTTTQSVTLPLLTELVVEFPKSSYRTISPNLAPPPTVDPSTGSPAPPEVEKSFMQKYWMYIVGLALFFAVQMGPDEPKGATPAAK
ncbi:uncharacterized protein I303_104180 [Kwoniella dejecticola CBS 10117]|uniref:ER membrane protein complex subunit 10 n=1 Tax=Kwoniella dejecticola CBS 10117 TaxID=1296121 RepID=A0A1A6A625_9TREE|nr:uncharacterized protein I303_04842 [Kwoniella dejecticola CBS 10117]OBR85506.1 hypothetical protein I303_04842 [Kwoniella dejecticola CBS 10117]